LALFQILRSSGDLSSVSGGGEREASWRIEPRASHMQTIFMPAFCSLESVKRKSVSAIAKAISAVPGSMPPP
jgi:hypothetical protein